MICLSFDIEEFDTPLEYGAEINLADQLDISTRGAERILDTLARHGVKATFFCTANFAQNRPQIIQQIVHQGHELASHSYYHSAFEPQHLAESRQVLESISGVRVVGYRSPRMGKVDHQGLLDAGYLYDSSVNPTFLPGRYNNLSEPRSIHRTASGLIEIPSSVSYPFRIPLFWLSVHNFPLLFVKYMAKGALSKDSYLNIYFHPWEFAEECHDPKFRLPFYVKRHAGGQMEQRLSSLISYFQSRDARFGILSELVTDKMAEK